MERNYKNKQMQRKRKRDVTHSASSSHSAGTSSSTSSSNPRVYFEIGLGSMIQLNKKGELSKPMKEIVKETEQEPLRVAGRIVFELYADRVPRTSENFRCLCTGENGASKQNQTKYLSFQFSNIHRIVPEFGIQGGDIINGDGSGGESIYGDTFPDESHAVKHRGIGMLMMANSARDTNNSQWFISTTKEKLNYLQQRYVIFGRVVQGFDVLRKIEQYGSENGVPKRMIRIVRCGRVKKEMQKKIKMEQEQRKGRSSQEGQSTEVLTPRTNLIGKVTCDKCGSHVKYVRRIPKKSAIRVRCVNRACMNAFYTQDLGNAIDIAAEIVIPNEEEKKKKERAAMQKSATEDIPSDANDDDLSPADQSPLNEESSVDERDEEEEEVEEEREEEQPRKKKQAVEEKKQQQAAKPTPKPSPVSSLSPSPSPSSSTPSNKTKLNKRQRAKLRKSKQQQENGNHNDSAKKVETAPLSAVSTNKLPAPTPSSSLLSSTPSSKQQKSDSNTTPAPATNSKPQSNSNSDKAHADNATQQHPKRKRKNKNKNKLRE